MSFDQVTAAPALTLEKPAGRIPAINPLSTRCVRPGTLTYEFAAGPRLNQLLDRLCDTEGWGQIIGPHGSGKSTLVHTLLPGLASAGFTPLLFTLHDRQRRLPKGWRRDASKYPPSVWSNSENPRKDGHPPHLRRIFTNANAMNGSRRMLIIDGYEQLSVIARWNLQRTCRGQRWGLLITAHQTQGLPMLYRTRTTPGLAQMLVTRLLGNQPIVLPTAEVQASFRRHGGNLRDVFLELFDLYETRRG